MNEFLAEMYGTRESIGVEGGDDVEKLAEAQLLDEALQAEGINIDDLPGDTILKLAHQILGEDSHLVKAAMEEAGEEGEVPKSAKSDEEEPMEEKVAQADFLGRVMAHSYVNELGEIEKNAGTGALSRFGAGVARQAKDVGEGFKGLGYMARHPVEAGKALKESIKGQGVKGTLSGSAKELKALGVGATGVGAAGYGAKKAFGGKSKKSSALEALAEKRAMEWAESVGLVGDENEKLAAAVDARAYEMLLENGIDVDAVEASL